MRAAPLSFHGTIKKSSFFQCQGDRYTCYVSTIYLPSRLHLDPGSIIEAPCHLDPESSLWLVAKVHLRKLMANNRSTNSSKTPIRWLDLVLLYYRKGSTLEFHDGSSSLGYEYINLFTINFQ